MGWRIEDFLLNSLDTFSTDPSESLNIEAYIEGRPVKLQIGKKGDSILSLYKETAKDLSSHQELTKELSKTGLE